jgi:hypothetical protein
MEQKIEELESKLNEQVAANVQLTKTISEKTRQEIILGLSEGLTDTETEKFLALAEELSFEDSDTFETKVKTIRENYFTKQKSIVESVVTDSPVQLTEDKKVTTNDPAMNAYVTVLNKLK